MVNQLPERIVKQARQACPECDADDIIKYGTKNGAQIYMCKPCGVRFTDNGAMPRRKIPPDQVGDAIALFYDGLSYRDIQRSMQTRYGYTPSTATLYEWVRDYSRRGKEFTDTFKADTGSKWVADEMMVKVDGHNVWLWNVMDADSRYLLATHISKTRTIGDAQKLFKKAKQRSQRPPKEIVTDGLRAYQEGIERTFGGDTRHTVSQGIRSNINNNMSERLQGTIRERTKVMRGMETMKTAALVMDGFRLHYNHMRPHSGIKGKTPAEMVGLPFVFQNWVEVAHLQDRTLEDKATQDRFKERWIRDRSFRSRSRI